MKDVEGIAGRESAVREEPNPQLQLVLPGELLEDVKEMRVLQNSDLRKLQAPRINLQRLRLHQTQACTITTAGQLHPGMDRSDVHA